MCIRCRENKAVVQYLPCNHIYHCVDCSIKARVEFKQTCHCGEKIEKVLYAYQENETKTQCDVCYEEWPNSHMIELTGDNNDCSHLSCVACALQNFRFEVLNKKLKILNDRIRAQQRP